MVNQGWGFEDLMRMPARDFAFWLDAQAAFSKRQAEEIDKAGKT